MSDLVEAAAPGMPAVRQPARRRRRLRLRLWIPTAFLVTLILVGFLAPLPFDPRTPDSSGVPLSAPSADHLMGTDKFGLDVYSRLLASAATDIPLAVGGMLISLVVGTVLGLTATLRGRRGERLVRALDVFQAFPLLLIAIAVVALMGNHLRNVIIAIVVLNIPRFIRLIRSEGLTIRESRYIEAAQAIGVSTSRLLFRHMLPNMTGTILAQASLAVANAIVVIASLSFLGIGINAADPSWGAMLQTGSQSITTGEWWAWVFPGAAIFLTILSLNVIGDELQDSFGRAVIR
jgi:peptide/nickel transport system permease protein